MLDLCGLSEVVWEMLTGGLCKVCTIEDVQVSDRPSLDGGLRAETELWLEITPKGGGLWESRAHPDWDRFYHIPLTEDDSQLTIMATNLPRIQEIVSHLPALLECRVEEQVTCTKCTPFKALYWKTLESGFSCEFKVHEVDDVDETLIGYAEFVRLRSWCTSIVGADVV